MTDYDNRLGPTHRVLGGSLLGVLVRLAVLSFVVGLILRALKITPDDIVFWIDEKVRVLTSLSFDTVEQFVDIFLLGAVIVVPIWLIFRVIRLVSR